MDHEQDVDGDEDEEELELELDEDEDEEDDGFPRWQSFFSPPFPFAEERVERRAQLAAAGLDPETDPDLARREEAQELAYRALAGSHGQMRAHLARRALELDEDCADAWTALAQEEPAPAERLDTLRAALAAAERRRTGAGGALAQPAARAGLLYGEALRTLGRLAEAEEAYLAVLERDPEDRQGARFGLSATLLEQGDHEAARTLRERYRGDPSAYFAWARMVERYLAGDLRGAVAATHLARSRNRIVDTLICGEPFDPSDVHPNPEQFPEAYTICKLLERTLVKHQEIVVWSIQGVLSCTPEERAAARDAYAPPLARLLDLDTPRRGKVWRRAALKGLGPEHVPELVRMLRDQALAEQEEDEPAVYAPVHAFRMLGRLRALEAVPAVLDMLREGLVDAWLRQDFACVFAFLGPETLPLLRDYLLDRESPDETWGLVLDTIRAIGEEHPEAREAAQETLAAVLRQHARNWPALNALVAEALANWHATPYEPLVREAFAAGHVHRMWTWDEEDLLRILRDPPEEEELSRP